MSMNSFVTPTFRQEECKVQCQSCPSRFISEKSLELHSMKCHGVGSKTRQCENCSKKFMGQLSLEKHKETCTVLKQQCKR